VTRRHPIPRNRTPSQRNDRPPAGADTARPASFRSLSPAIAPGSSHSRDLIMADYHSSTVVQPTIPIADITPLERLLLTRIFEAEPDGDGLYLSAEIGPTEAFAVAAEDLRTAFNQSAGTPSTASDYFAERMADIGDGDTYIEVDLRRTFPKTNQGPVRGQPWAFILQDIVRRSATLDRITVVSAFTCTQMRPHRFGGMAVLITADAIRGKSTNDILEDLLSEARSDPGPARSHVLLWLNESAVRSEIAQVIETDEAVTVLTADAVTDADIRAACRAVVEHTDLSEEQGAAVFRAALAAIREAERRHAAST
jgi:hypothetical protein